MNLLSSSWILKFQDSSSSSYLSIEGLPMIKQSLKLPKRHTIDLYCYWSIATKYVNYIPEKDRKVTLNVITDLFRHEIDNQTGTVNNL